MKKMSFENAVKDLKKAVISSEHPREVLKYIYFDGDNLYATNGIIFIQLHKNAVELPQEEPFFYNPYEESFIDGQNMSYPNITKLISGLDAEHTKIELDNKTVQDMKKTIRELQTIAGKTDNQVVKVETKENEIAMVSKYGIESMNLSITDCTVSGTDRTVHLNSDFLKKMLTVSNKWSKLSKTKSSFKIYSGSNRPINLSDDQTFKILIAPIRMH